MEADRPKDTFRLLSSPTGQARTKAYPIFTACLIKAVRLNFQKKASEQQNRIWSLSERELSPAWGVLDTLNGIEQPEDQNRGASWQDHCTTHTKGKIFFKKLMKHKSGLSTNKKPIDKNLLCDIIVLDCVKDLVNTYCCRTNVNSSFELRLRSHLQALRPKLGGRKWEYLLYLLYDHSQKTSTFVPSKSKCVVFLRHLSKKHLFWSSINGLVTVSFTVS